MVRLTVSLVVAALAVAVSVVAAVPAAAAKGGNSDNAHACQRHARLFEAKTGNPFKNAGDCASHGAKGGAYLLLQILPTSYPCNSQAQAHLPAGEPSPRLASRTALSGLSASSGGRYRRAASCRAGT
jgi:hypothetical protein